MELISRRCRVLRRAAVSGLCLVMLSIPVAAFAQPAAPAANLNQEAIELAQRLGRECSAEGLETIINTHNVDLVTAYERGFRETLTHIATEAKKNIPLPDDIEALIVKHYDDPQVGAALRMLFTSSRTVYQTRALFDLMYAEWRSGKVRPSTYPIRDSILQTEQPGIEGPLLELLLTLAQPEQADGTRLINFIAARKYRPAVPVFTAMSKNAKPGAQFASTLQGALLTIGTPDAIDALLQRLVWLREQPPGPDVAKEIAALASRISQAPVETPLDYASFRKALPTTLNDEMKSSLLSFIARRKEKQGVPDALLLLAETKFYQRSLEALVALDSPEIWKQARVEVERLNQQGALNDGQYRYATSLLDPKIADPEKYFAEQQRRGREKEFDAKRTALYAARNTVQKLKDAQPEQYVTGYLDFLKGKERLAQEYADLPSAAGLRSETANDYVNLGHLVRFKLRQPARALEIYASAERLENQLPAVFSLADFYQFEMRDKAKALAEYERMRELLQRARTSGNDMEAGFGNWAKNWLTHQVEYLKTGKTFSGAVTRDEIAGPAMLMYFGAGFARENDYLGLGPLNRMLSEATSGKADAPQLDRKTIAETLNALPPSSMTLMGSVALMTLMPDAGAILNFLARHDPAGYATAGFFALVDMVGEKAGAARETAMLLPGLALPPSDSTSPLRAAAARFFTERRINLTTQPDPRMSSPEKTWNLLIASLKSGDLDTAFACMTPGIQNKFRPIFTQLPPDKLRAMAESFRGFAMTTHMGDGMEEAVVVRGTQAGMIYFVNVGGAWKINEM